ncbi:class I SAM-dependent methyltransferase [Acanthopleuribacter pedis]|uniref:Class I SAM-dependent methyltransferase n=1 Tax=Acanthopleuribacter pedis TaxID=442870 RepID=A0A8J7U7I2_9BACT|nr:class I SAM-dependent methyltransferase [Acanthopleuribacter pedis]MBO1322543.1 class I SAM-dependent methyltransferase [Acanthopleuribacter pedis]
MSHYAGIAGYYDQLMDGGYYDHRAMSQNLLAVVGTGKKILELGVGTGLTARALSEADPSAAFTGIDFSPAMLEIARDRLPDNIRLVECDVAEMDLGIQFDAAVSTGGTWVIIRSEAGLMLGTHLYHAEKDRAGLHRVAEHLVPGGLLVLSVHPPHEDHSLQLPNGLVYSQELGKPSTDDAHFFIEKKYRFTRDQEHLAEDRVVLGFYRDTLYPEMLADAGFKPLGLTNNEDFFVFKKVD